MVCCNKQRLKLLKNEFFNEKNKEWCQLFMWIFWFKNDPTEREGYMRRNNILDRYKSPFLNKLNKDLHDSYQSYIYIYIITL